MKSIQNFCQVSKTYILMQSIDVDMFIPDREITIVHLLERYNICSGKKLVEFLNYAYSSLI